MSRKPPQKAAPKTLTRTRCWARDHKDAYKLISELKAAQKWAEKWGVTFAESGAPESAQTAGEHAKTIRRAILALKKQK